MADGEDSPRFGEVDSDGFRAFTVCDNDGVPFISVYLHVDRLCKHLEDLSEPQQDGLKTAAAIAAALHESPLRDPVQALDVLQSRLVPHLVREQLCEHFPSLTNDALKLVVETCVMSAIGAVIESNKGPRIYGKDDAERLIQPFADNIKNRFLSVTGHRKKWRTLSVITNRSSPGSNGPMVWSRSQ